VAQELARLETELEALIASHGSFRFRRPSRTSAERTYSSTRTPKTLPRQEPKAPPVTPVKVKTKTRVSRPATKRPSLLWLVPIMIYLSCALTGTPNLSELRPSTGLFLFMGHAIVVGYLSKQWLRRRREWRYLGSTSRMPVLGLNLIWIWAVALVALKAQYG
jgi:hypothetical protein